MNKKRILAFADRIENVRDYSPSDLGADSSRQYGKKKSRKYVRIILVNAEQRELLADALREFAYTQG